MKQALNPVKQRQRVWIAVALVLGLHVLFSTPHTHATGPEQQACVACQVSASGAIITSAPLQLGAAFPVLEGWLSETSGTAALSKEVPSHAFSRGPPALKHA